ncbi:hypothetical protein D3C71_530350 [compost metagenome]
MIERRASLYSGGDRLLLLTGGMLRSISARSPLHCLHQSQHPSDVGSYQLSATTRRQRRPLQLL